MRRPPPLTALAVLLAALLVAAPALGASSALVQNVDTSAYPTIVLTLVVSPDAVSSSGDVPAVAVSENGDPVGDVSVSSLEKERQPIDVVLLVDASGSMKGQPLADAKVAARRFVESMEPSDRIAIVAFASEPGLLQDFTSDRGKLFAQIDGIQASGETALYDGLVQAANTFAASTASERYIVALSDGGDTLSINPPDNAAAAVTSAKAPVYAVALDSPEYNPATLETIAAVSGGRMTSVAESGSLADVYESIAREMQLRYSVQFVSGRPNTRELDLQVTVGSGEAAVVTGATIGNPLFEGAAANRKALEISPPDAFAFISAIAAIFGSITLLIFGSWLILRRDHAAFDQLRYYDQLRSSDTDDAAYEGSSVRSTVLATLGELAERQGFTGLIQDLLESAGIALRANEYILFHVLGTIAAGVLTVALTQGALLWSFLAIMIAVTGPLVYLRLRAEQRLRRFNEQLPDILDLIAGSLRSGWGIQQSLDLVVDEVGDPARSEFRRSQAEARLGLPIEEALERMAGRIKSDDLRWTVSAITIQREVGGNLAEVLNTVSRTIRERAELKRQVSALTAEGRLSMTILTVLPFVVFGLMLVVNPRYMLLAVQNPLGVFAYIFGGVLLLVGLIWLNRIIRIEV